MPARLSTIQQQQRQLKRPERALRAEPVLAGWTTDGRRILLRRDPCTGEPVPTIVDWHADPFRALAEATRH